MDSGDNQGFCPKCGSELETKEVDGRERDFCPECAEVTWKNPKPVAWALVETGDGFLLVKRAHEPDRGLWDIPGGFLEMDESFSAAAVRELEEETGVKLSDDALDLHTTLSFDRAETPVVGVVFHVSSDVSVEDVSAGSDAEEARFWSGNDIERGSEELRPACQDILERLRNRRK